MKKLTEEQIQRNMRSVAHAIAQQELEGLTVPEETVEDLRRVARGEMTTDDLFRKLYARHGKEYPRDAPQR
jgi:hypothetical protein